jgi:hypothetical protein
MVTILKELVAPDRRRKVQILRRGDGSFGLESLQRGAPGNELESSWLNLCVFCSDSGHRGARGSGSR